MIRSKKWRITNNEENILEIAWIYNISDFEAESLIKKYVYLHTLDAYIFHYWHDEWAVLYKAYCDNLKWKHYSNINYIMESKWVSYDEAIIMKNDYLSKTKQDKSSFINRYGEELWLEKYNSFVNKSKQTKENYILRYWEVEWLKLWNELCKKHSESISKDAFILKYWYDEWLTKYNEYCKSRTNIFKKDYYIEKYGEDEWLQLWDELSRKKAINKDTFINKYWYDEGLVKYDDYISRKTSKILVKNYIKEYWEIEWLRLYRKSIRWNNSYSKISIKCFDEIINYFWLDNWLVEYKDNEFIILLHSNNKDRIQVDFKYWNKIIEFYGDFWHANPRIYKSGDFNEYSGKLVDDIWSNDIFRENIIYQNGFDLFIIWEYDYKNKKEELFSNLSNFLYK